MGRQQRESVQQEVRERRREIQQLMLAGYTLAQLYTYGERHGWSFAQVKNDYTHISDAWSKQSEEELQHARSQAIQRIRRDLTEMRAAVLTKKGKGKKGAVQEAMSFKDIATHEMLLARIEGTLRPVEVKVDVRASSRRALIDVINGMTPEEMDQLVEDQRALEMKFRG